MSSQRSIPTPSKAFDFQKTIAPGWKKTAASVKRAHSDLTSIQSDLASIHSALQALPTSTAKTSIETKLANIQPLIAKHLRSKTIEVERANHFVKAFSKQSTVPINTAGPNLLATLLQAINNTAGQIKVKDILHVVYRGMVTDHTLGVDDCIDKKDVAEKPSSSSSSSSLKRRAQDTPAPALKRQKQETPCKPRPKIQHLPCPILTPSSSSSSTSCPPKRTPIAKPAHPRNASTTFSGSLGGIAEKKRPRADDEGCSNAVKKARAAPSVYDQSRVKTRIVKRAC